MGGFVGALVGMGIPEFEAKLYDLRLKEGGVLVAVHCESFEGISKARDVLKSVGAEDIATCLEESLSSSCEDSDVRLATIRRGSCRPIVGWLPCYVPA